ncbi:MAG: O-antigen ligase family protein [Paludibacteraceae bacterium]|nr:O-antigen ligase family protein [Paludibacteraceae bacterium]
MGKQFFYCKVQDIPSIVLYITAIAVSFIGWMAPVPVIALTLCCLILTFQKYRSGEKLELNKTAACMLAFYLFMLLADLFNGIPFASLNRMDFQIRIPLLLLSIAFLFKHKELDTQKALKCHAIGSYATALTILLTFVWEICFDFDGIERNLYHMRQCLAAIFVSVSHRSYVNFNLLVALIFVFQSYNRQPCNKRLIHFIIISIATGGFIFLSEARASIISYGVVLLIMILLLTKEKLNRRQMAILLTLCGIGLLCAIVSVPRVTNLFHSLMRGDTSWLDLDPRFRIWSCAHEIAAQGIPLLGWGAGELQPLLQECYSAVGFQYGETYSLGTHNQFIEILLEYGYLGLTLLLALLASLVFRKKMYRKELFLWLILLLINLFFENMLSRAIGSYNIAFLLVLWGNREDSTEEEQTRRFTKTDYILIPLILIIAIGYIRSNKSKHFVTFQKHFAVVENPAETLPSEMEGSPILKIDHTTPTESWGEVAFMNYYFDELKMKTSDSIHFSLYVYVDESFNGSLVRIKLDERNTNIYECYYDLGQKGTWQKLVLDKSGLEGNVACNISIDKTPAKDFSELKGYVLFSKPAIQTTEK